MHETITEDAFPHRRKMKNTLNRYAEYKHPQMKFFMGKCVLLLLSVLAAACSRTSPADKANRPDLVGTIGPNVIRVPAQDLLFYESEPGTKELKGKCERPLRSLVIRLRWPDMEPLNENNAEDYQVHHRQSVGNSHWIEIGMTRLTPTEKVTLSGTRDFLLYRGRIVSSYPDGLPLTYGYSTDAGLKFAHLSTPLPHEVNSIVYSDQVEKGKESSILIDCTHGSKYDPPRWTPLCDQLVVEPGLAQVKVTISYRANLLPEWPQITSAVHSYLQKTRAQCPSNRK
ncbi:hypothetical protein VDR28_11060 [Xanthomonas campestris pv. campestris]|nr:hypothetical protein [Xanthomonas campestris pv. campestris]MEB1720128.1 hypothetical protein [Xanthomonas campestris pv. campestris]MEB1849174.1 hypothetical protein [Xanthomonas campestris pv. campestris]